MTLGYAADDASGENKFQIGYVDVRKVMANAPQIEQIHQHLSERFRQQRQMIIKLRNEVAHLGAEYDKHVAGEVQNRSRGQVQLLQQLDDKQTQLDKLQKQVQKDYNLQRNQSLEKLQSLIVQMVAKVAKEEHLDMVLNDTVVIYVSSRIDITQKVMTYLSEQSLD